MKKSEVKIGGIYSNGKGRIRKVVDIGPQYKLYDEQECLENLRYEIVHDGSKNNCTAGEQGNMTVASFAAWAKERIQPEFNPWKDSSFQGPFFAIGDL